MTGNKDDVKLGTERIGEYQDEKEKRDMEMEYMGRRK